MLSFGHAAYFGVGAFATVHAMNALGGTGLLPTPLLPLVGRAGRAADSALIAGWFATQRSGTYFAMITLAIAELLHALAPHLKGLFGGEAGISTMRMPAMGSELRLDHAGVLPDAGLGAGLARPAVLPHAHAAGPTHAGAARKRAIGCASSATTCMGWACRPSPISAMFSGIAGGLQVLSNEAANYVRLRRRRVGRPWCSTAISAASGSFLGPALGASLMSFFGYAVSDTHAVLAALPGRPVRAGDDVHARGADRAW